MIATGKDKTPPTYQKGTITGWSTQVYQKAYARDSASLMGHKKFYDLKGAGLVYQIAGIDHPLWGGRERLRPVRNRASRGLPS